MGPGRRLSRAEQRESVQTLRAGMALADMPAEQLWHRAVALDGALSEADVVAVLDGLRVLTAHEHDVLAQALNDHFVVDGGNHPVRYSAELDGDRS